MTVPEKSTNQLAVWRDLIAAMDELTATWARTQTTGPHTTATTQLPANVAAALAHALDHATDAIAGATHVLAAQQDSGTRFQPVADALRVASDMWPRSRQHRATQ